MDPATNDLLFRENNKEIKKDIKKVRKRWYSEISNIEENKDKMKYVDKCVQDIFNEYGRLDMENEESIIYYITKSYEEMHSSYVSTDKVSILFNIKNKE